MPRPTQPQSIPLAKVHVVEDDEVVKYEVARIDVLSKTAKLYTLDVASGRFRVVDTLRHATLRAGSGGHMELTGEADSYRAMGLEGEDALVTWRYWPAKDVASPEPMAV